VIPAEVRQARRRVEAAADRAGRQRPLRSVVPGWWVYSYGPAGGGWGQVTTVVRAEDQQVRLVLVEYGTGRRAEVVQDPSYPAHCLTATQARRVGLTDPPAPARRG
jgi:hypothetical protein